MQINAHIDVPFEHRLRFTRDVFAPHNAVLRELMEGEEIEPRKIVFIDAGLDASQPQLQRQIRRWFDRDELATITAVPGGEAAKNTPSLWQDVARQIAGAGIDRHSFVIAVGGGAVLDAVGFAAATVHRGVRLIRVCSTTLSQSDSGVGVKSGVNLAGKKNMLGAFAVPWAVINDFDLLHTLDEVNWRAGFSEAVKVALIKDAAFFDDLCDRAGAIAQRDMACAEPVIRRSAELHFRHIVEGGDPFELGSSRPLDLGHWSAHRLEQLSKFALGHGEAVAIGVAIDVVYATSIGLLRDDDARRVVRCLADLGFVLSHEVLADSRAVMEGLEEFREHLGGPLTLILPAGIGRTATVHTVDEHRMVDAIQRVADGALTAI
jgi:3-dehydroquinate synthase